MAYSEPQALPPQASPSPLAFLSDGRVQMVALAAAGLLALTLLVLAVRR